MRFLRSLLTLSVFLLAACATTPEPPSPTSEPTKTAVPTNTPLPQRLPLLRVAILGQTTTTNVWAIFDESGANYWNNAVQSYYWPRLYHLAPPSLEFAPAAAKGEPSPLVCDTATCTATVTLQPNLTWTDDSPLTADDVAFTTNLALQFRLGLNWRQAYNPDVLDHAEALDGSTVKYYFKGIPTVADWQYGVLQGPIVSQAYWQPRIVKALGLLPDDSLLPTIQELEGEFSDMQAQVDSLNLSLNGMAPASTVYQDTSKQAQRLQDELNSLYTRLEKNRTEYETKLAEARASLFSLANTNEPTLGPWQFESRIEGNFQNRVNLGTPFGDPWFDSVRYISYPNELAAVQALENDDVDIILTPAGLSSNSVSGLENESGRITLSRNVTRSARFLAFNNANPYLADPALHQALACILDPQRMLEGLNGEAAPLTSFVLEDFWRSEEASLPCRREPDNARLEHAVRILKTAGYSWSETPTSISSGTEMKNPDGNVLPRLTLLVSEEDTLRVEVASYIAHQADILGLSLEVKTGDADELLYAVYGSRKYDMAVLGWRLGVYPAYLCEWFKPPDQNAFAYSGSKLEAECEAWEGTDDLGLAKAHASEVQSILMQDLPLIPLYTGVRIDAYRNIRYPFDNIIDGLSGLYGAPALAIPIQ